MRFGILVLGVLAAGLVSGCESAGLPEFTVWEKNNDVEMESAEVRMREDTGETMTPDFVSQTPQGYRPHYGYVPNESSVDLFNTRTTAYGGVMPSYSGGVATADPSVTVFPVDGAVPVMHSGRSVGPSDYHSQQTSNYNRGSHSVYFRHGSSRLGRADKTILSDAAEKARFAPVDHITVVGYASRPTQAGSNSRQSGILNLKESMNRSFEASKTLIQQGVPAEKIKTVSWGSGRATGNQQTDRRVDVVMGDQ